MAKGKMGEEGINSPLLIHFPSARSRDPQNSLLNVPVRTQGTPANKRSARRPLE